jgi:mono/diheme cytochrome c family protein
MKQNNTAIRKYVIATVLAAAGCGLVLRAAPASGADTYKAKCAACHGADGSGNTPMGKRFQIKDLRSPDVQKQSDANLADVIANGKPPMPALGKTLSAADIQGLVVYIRALAKS